MQAVESALLALDDAGIPAVIARYYLRAVAVWATRPDTASAWHISRYAIAIARGIEREAERET